MLQCKWRIATVVRKAVLHYSVDRRFFECSIQQCMESVIAFYQNVRYDNDNL